MTLATVGITRATVGGGGAVESRPGRDCRQERACWLRSRNGGGANGGGKWLSVVGDEVGKVWKEGKVGKGLKIVGGRDFSACRQKVEKARSWWWKRTGGGGYDGGT